MPSEKFVARCRFFDHRQESHEQILEARLTAAKLESKVIPCVNLGAIVAVDELPDARIEGAHSVVARVGVVVPREEVANGTIVLQARKKNMQSFHVHATKSRMGQSCYKRGKKHAVVPGDEITNGAVVPYARKKTFSCVNTVNQCDVLHDVSRVCVMEEDVGSVVWSGGTYELIPYTTSFSPCID